MIFEKLRRGGNGVQQGTNTYPSWFTPTVGVLDRMLCLCYSEKEVFTVAPEEDYNGSDEDSILYYKPDGSDEDSILYYKPEIVQKKARQTPRPFRRRPFRRRPLHFQSGNILFRIDEDHEEVDATDNRSIDQITTKATVSMNSWSWDSVDSHVPKS
jgi:hypothetical protein